MYEYKTLSTTFDAGVLTVIVSNPPINIMTRELYQDLVAFTADVAVDKDVKVVVFESADPDFFIAHFDISQILTFPTDKPAERNEQLSDFHLMCERLRTMGG